MFIHCTGPKLHRCGHFDSHGETLTNLLETVQKYVINRFLQLNSLNISKFSSNNRICMFVHCNGPKLPKFANTEKSRTDGAFMGKQWYCY